MHELGIADGIVRICAEPAGDARVIRVRTEIGQLAAVLPDAARFCFDVCARETVVAGAVLEIIETPARAACGDCAREVALEWPFGHCACGSANLRAVAGDELKVREMELA